MRCRARFARVPVLLEAALVSVCFGLPGQQSDSQKKAGAPGETAELHLGKGHEALKTNRYQEAISEFRAALAVDPGLVVRARFPLAVALFNMQDREQARQEFEEVRVKTGDDPNVSYYLGRLDLMEGKLDSAIHHLTLAAANPPFPDTAYYLGYAYVKKGDMVTAEEWLHKAAELAPHDFRVQERLGLLYRATGRKDEAEKAFGLSADLHKQDVDATATALECGRTLETRPLEEARAVCRKLFDPVDSSKLVTLGTIYGQHGNYADALEPFRRAAELEPDSYEIQYNVGLTYFRLKRYAEARAPLEKAVSLRPDMFETTAPLGAVLYALGDDLTAYPVLSRAHQLDPSRNDVAGFLLRVAMNLAQKGLDNKEYTAAIQYLLQAAEVRPSDSEVHRRLAEVYKLAGDESKAAEEREQAQRLSQTGH